MRPCRELKERSFAGGHSVVRDRMRELQPFRPADFDVRFKTPAGEQLQVDFAMLEVEFVDEPGVKRIIWLFSMVLGYSLAGLGALRCPLGSANSPSLSSPDVEIAYCAGGFFARVKGELEWKPICPSSCR